jgi:GT2 family glycosyltransferase
MAEVPLSVIIPVFNHLDTTVECLHNLKEHTPGSYEVIVVDNGSTDGTAKYLARAGVRVLTNKENMGFPFAVNRGIKAAKGENICLLNNDVVVLEGWLEPLLRCLSEDPRVGAVGPKQVSPQGVVWHAGTAFYPNNDALHPRAPFHVFLGFKEDDPAVNIKRSYPALNFGCAVIRAGLFEEIGLMDEDTFLFPGLFEDVDWCIRMRKRGFKCVYCPESEVIHDANQTQFKSGDSLKKKSLEAQELNLERLLEKWKDEPESFLVPVDMRPVIEQHLSSDIYRKQAHTTLRRELAKARKYNIKLETELRRAKGHIAELEEYIGHVERSWKDQCGKTEQTLGLLESARDELATKTAELDAEKKAVPTTRHARMRSLARRLKRTV